MCDQEKTLHQEPAAKKAKSKAKSARCWLGAAKSTGDKLTLMAMAKLLPKEAQKDDYDGSTKSYTLRKEDSVSSIGVLVDKEAFYVCPVEAIPKEFEDDFKINGQENVCFSPTPTHFR